MKSTTYGAFGIYKYPAKFIPQIIIYILKNYISSNARIFDPFAGYGTVGLVSRIFGCDYELWDLNPITEIVHKTALLDFRDIDISQYVDEMKKSELKFIPDWSNWQYWIPDEFISVITKSWGYFHSMKEDLKPYFLIPLLKTTRFFSFSDEKVHKLYKSKFSKRKVMALLDSDWESRFFSMLKFEVKKLLNKLQEYKSLNPKNVRYELKVGRDLFENELSVAPDVLITSPPYLQAQEYIRSTKLELYFAGFDENYIKKLSRKEIPYSKFKKTEILSEKYYYYRNKIQEEHLIRLYDSYFHSILRVFQNFAYKVKEYMFIFVGPAKIRTTPIPIDEIIVEHLQNFGWKHEITFIDKIVSRAMFQSKINPASKNEDERMKTEHLIVLKREE